MAGSVAADIDRRFAAARVPGSPNGFTAAEVRELAIEYLAELDDELLVHPWIAGQPHWNLWMDDTRLEDAMFAVIVFGTAGIEFVCGTGDAFAVRRWDCDAAGDVSSELRRDFTVPAGGLVIDRSAGEAWLGRSW